MFEAVKQDLTMQLAYPAGSPERFGVRKAYGESQKWQLTASVAICFQMIPCVMAGRKYQLEDHRQIKATVV